MTKLFFVLVSCFTLVGCVPKIAEHYDGEINQDTGLVFISGHWERAWWSDQFETARKKGCHLEDSCGIFPPDHVGVQYCGDPQMICPGKHWAPETRKIN